MVYRCKIHQNFPEYLDRRIRDIKPRGDRRHTEFSQTSTKTFQKFSNASITIDAFFFALRSRVLQSENNTRMLHW